MYTYLMLSKGLGSFNTAIAFSTVPSEDWETTDVSSTWITQLAPGGNGAPVLIRAHSLSLKISWHFGYKIIIFNFIDMLNNIHIIIL